MSEKVAEGFRRYEIAIVGEGRGHRFHDQPKEIGLDKLDINALIRRLKRGEWIEDIHGWRINPAQVVGVRVRR